MLSCKEFRWCHKCALAAVVYGTQAKHKGNKCLSRTYVSLQEPLHGKGLFFQSLRAVLERVKFILAFVYVPVHLENCRHLPLGKFKGKSFHKLFLPWGKGFHEFTFAYVRC